ncbi:large ribosomal subunit protein eL20z-like [Typha angustifolia]|uniref:large ribosomal subunit protein eL20z-like n=1 Tax=Typha angustifolia TaxID=59011 RepID=UPI003C2CADCF
MAVSEGKGDLAKIRFDQSIYGTFAPPPPQPSAPRPPQTPIPCNYDPQQPPNYLAIPVGYQSPPFPALVEGVPVSEPAMPVCGIGIGWALFLSGFFIAAIPWYVGAFLLLFVALDYREKPGLVACTVAAILALIPVILNAFRL